MKKLVIVLSINIKDDTVIKSNREITQRPQHLKVLQVSSASLGEGKNNGSKPQT